jgi:iron complex outermembrane receptor protein
VDVVHTPGYCGDLACSALSRNDAYNLVNARLTYLSSSDAWRVALEVTNVTDKLYTLNKLNTAYASSQPGLPRAWAVTVRRSF